MFCSNCGAQAQGNFCSRCGHQLHQSAATAPVWHHQPTAISFRAADQTAGHSRQPDENAWWHDVNYRKLISRPDVRDRIMMAGNRSPVRITGEQLLHVLDEIAPGASLVAIAVQPIYLQLGIRTGKSIAERVNLPVGKTIVEVLCSLAENGNELRDVKQAEDGLLLEATIPFDILSFEGVIYVQIHRDGPGSIVEAATQIPGQFFDWGKSQRLLKDVLGDLHRAA